MWIDKPEPGSPKTTVYLYDLATPKEQKIITGTNIVDVKISGDRLLWSEKRDGGVDIFLYNLGPNSILSQKPINPNGPVTSFDIDGNKIVWRDEQLNLYLLDISSDNNRPKLIASNVWGTPAISDKLIVWDQAPARTIYYLDLTTNNINQIDSSTKQSVRFDVSGTKIVWGRQVSSGTREIYFYDTQTGGPVVLITTIRNGIGPVISGDTIAWIVYRYQGSRDSVYDIYAYSIPTGIMKPIVTNDKVNKNDLAIFDNRLVWSDARNRQFAQFDIYSMKVPK